MFSREEETQDDRDTKEGEEDKEGENECCQPVLVLYSSAAVHLWWQLPLTRQFRIYIQTTNTTPYSYLRSINIYTKDKWLF